MSCPEASGPLASGFPDVDVPVVLVPQVQGKDELEEAVARAATTGGLIVHTLVDSSLREQMEVLTSGSGVVAVDAMGPVIEQLSRLVGKEALGRPGMYRKLREDYFRRVEAIEYAVAHDDGRNTNELELADVVLAGVSRVGKTPLSMYLAMLGWKAANVPLVNGMAPPPQLFEIARRRVVGLTIMPERLQAHRRRRQVFRRGRFTTVDISDKPIEETANEVVARLERR